MSEKPDLYSEYKFVCDKYNKLADRYNNFADDFEKLQQQLKDANEVIAFYGDEDNYYGFAEWSGVDGEAASKKAREYQERWKL